MKIKVVLETHILAAVETYLKSLSLIEDDETIVTLTRRSRTGDYIIEVETE